MKRLYITKRHQLDLIQKACETLVVDNLINLPHIYNVADRKVLLSENQQANEMVDRIRELIRSTKSECSNPKS